MRSFRFGVSTKEVPGRSVGPEAGSLPAIRRSEVASSGSLGGSRVGNSGHQQARGLAPEEGPKLKNVQFAPNRQGGNSRT